VSQTRRLAAILAADVAGYSRLMGADEEGTLERLKALRRELLDPKIAEHHGRVPGLDPRTKTTGDGPAGRVSERSCCETLRRHHFVAPGSSSLQL
jgi:class 3 adenylate cyclase